jgi:hypothetical protein
VKAVRVEVKKVSLAAMGSPCQLLDTAADNFGCPLLTRTVPAAVVADAGRSTAMEEETRSKEEEEEKIPEDVERKIMENINRGETRRKGVDVHKHNRSL